MTCVYKENEDKIKMVEEEWLQLKMQVLLDLLDYNMKIVIWWGKINLWCQKGKYKFGEGESTGGGFFQMGGWANFWLAGGTPLILQ